MVLETNMVTLVVVNPHLLLFLWLPHSFWSISDRKKTSFNYTQVIHNTKITVVRSGCIHSMDWIAGLDNWTHF